MPPDPIKAALVAAAQARIGTLIGEPPEAWGNIQIDPADLLPSAAAVAAFLRAMNPHGRRAGFNLAADVEEAVARAAQEARDDR